MSSSLSPAGRVYTAMAWFEAFTWAGLLVGMFLKYVTVTTDLGVWWFGRLHGLAFLLYLAATLLAAIRLRWSLGVTVLAILAAIAPLTTLPLEFWLRRSGRLRSYTSDAA